MCIRDSDVALFLKEMPRFERNYHGLGRPLLEALRVRYIVLSFPEVSTHGGRNLVNRYRDFCHQLIAGHDWPITELLFEGELVFIIRKTWSIYDFRLTIDDLIYDYRFTIFIDK